MKKSSILFIIACCLFAACNNTEVPESITGAQLKGEWLQFVNAKQIISYQFSGDARVSRTMITPAGYRNEYRDGYYNIDNNNIVLFINEYDAKNDRIEYYTRSSEWQFVALQDSVLALLDKDVQISLFKVLHEINIDLATDKYFELSNLFNEADIVDIQVFDEKYVHVVKAKKILMGLTHGSTYVQILLTNGKTVTIKVNVLSKDLDAFVYMHKIIGCPLELVDRYWGMPEYEQNDMPNSKMYIVNKCHTYAISMENTLLVDAVTMRYGDFIEDIIEGIYTDEYVQQYMEKMYTFIGEFYGELYYMIDVYSPDELLIVINQEEDYVYIY